jgi:murein DD-endopeptidase MepM/ murein hydrolase activator NlpD
MFKTGYKFNPETLSYDKMNLSFRQKMFRIFLLVFGFSSLVAVITFLVFYYYFDTTSYESMMHEKKMMLQQYKSLNKKISEINRVLDDMQNSDDKIIRTLLNIEPVSPSIRNAGIGGTDKYEKLRGYDNSGLVVEISKKIDQISARANVQALSYTSLLKIAKSKSNEFDCLPALIPVSKDKCHITSLFGYRTHPIFKRKQLHEGVDFAAPIGTNIYAPGDGVISNISYNGGYGRILRISHGFGYVTKYAHLQKIYVKKDQHVKRGDLIATVGNSGLSTGPHLHYEVYKNGKLQNPIDYTFGDLSPEEFHNIHIIPGRINEKNEDEVEVIK